jgi:MspA
MLTNTVVSAARTNNSGIKRIRLSDFWDWLLTPFQVRDPRSLVLKFFRVFLSVVALLCVGSGVAGADPVHLGDVVRSAPPDVSGWRLTVALADMNINAVPNMAATPFTREGFVTVTATMTIDGGGPASSDIGPGKLELWYQLGCQSDLSQGMSITNYSHATDSLHTTADSTGAAGASAITGGSDDPGFLAQVNPGGIDDERKGGSLGEMRWPDLNPAGGIPPLTKQDVDDLRQLKDGRSLVRTIHVQDFHVQRDNCGGAVSIRLHARASMATWRSDTDVDVYSDILPL